MRWGMVIDTNLCVGCEACTVACKVRHGNPPGIWLAPVLEKEEGRFPNVRRTFLPLLCSHCKEPACLKACPTRAIKKRPDDGIVMVDKERCCGVKACMAACPYGALHFYEKEEGCFPGKGLTPLEQFWYSQHRVGTVQKCDFCFDLVDDGQLPRCVDVCPATCRIFGDLDDPDSEASKLLREKGAGQLRPEVGTDPSVYYVL